MKSAVQPLPVARGATIDIAWEWANWLNAGETVVGKDVTVSSGLSLVSSEVDESGTKVNARLTVASDLALGTQLQALCKATTSSGEVDPRKYLMIVKEK